jgi:hypothetical protein
MELTKRLSWRTKQAQFFQSFGCGQVHVIRFMGTCEACNRSVYSHGCQGAKPCGDTVASSPDPRGIIPPEHCMNLYHANEYGMKGRDLITCYSCSEDGDRYRAIMAKTKAAGTWAPALKHAGFYVKNPPDDWEECGQCDGYHPAGFNGDCRDDYHRWPSAAAIEQLEATEAEARKKNL